MICVYNQKDKMTLATEIQVNYMQLGNVNLLTRPEVPGQTLIDAGWTDAGSGTATVYSMSYSAGSDGFEWNGPDVLIHITPIKANGTVIGPDALDAYVEGLLSGSTIQSVLTADTNGLVLWVQPANGGWDATFEYGELYDDILHRLQAVYYLDDFEEFPDIEELRAFDESISLYGDFNGNGDAVLEPLEGRIRQVAGGEYSFSLDHPLDPQGKWKLLKREAIVKLPVPAEVIPNSYAGIEADVYRVTEDGAALRSAASEPQTISYTLWSIDAEYAVGTKVTWQGKNYKCNFYDETSPYAHIAPPSCSWWTEIARTTPGAAELVKLKSGTKLYYVETVDTTWYKMTTMYGLTGYIRKNQVTFDHHASASENQPRTITEQLFRVKDVNIDRDGGKVSLSGVHVSYDLNGNLVDSMEVGQVSAAMAIGILNESLLMGYQGMIATNLSDTEDGTFTGSFKRKNGMFCLTDPDTGIVPAFNAKLSRDNWDLFIMEDTDTNRGYRIRYAKNVNGIQWREKTDGLVTRVMPVAKAEDGSDLLLPEMYVDSEHISDYPVVYMETLNVKGQVGKDDGSGTDTLWTEANLLDEMRAKAGERFSIKKADLPVTEVTVQLEQLEKTAEFAWMGDLLKVVLYDMVSVSDPEIGKSMTLKVTELEYDIVKKKIAGLKLSNTEPQVARTVTGYNVANKSIGMEKLKDEAVSAIRGGAVDTAVEDSQERMPVVQANSATAAGIVAAGGSNAGKVWKTDNDGNPAWRDESGAGFSVIDNLTSTSTTDALSANQGKVLSEKIERTVIPNGTLSSIQTALETMIESMENNEVRNIRFGLSTASGYFETLSYLGTIIRIASGRCIVDVSESTKVTGVIHGIRYNNTWTWGKVTVQT